MGVTVDFELVEVKEPRDRPYSKKPKRTEEMTDPNRTGWPNSPCHTTAEWEEPVVWDYRR